MMGWSERLADCEGFQWDDRNAHKIWKKHRVTTRECEEMFLAEPLIVGADEEHSTREERGYALGRTDVRRLLFVAFTIRGRAIRVISARDMSLKERRIYTSQ